MNRAISGPVVVGILVVALIVLVVVGYRYFGGGKSGEKPQLDRQINRMYSPPQPGGPSAAQPGGANPTPQGR